ncbi:hypothetical protein TTHERM_000729097 (macronuclear) [Tetrahymena thermophila SB210]|uniref:Uncharacterized protein n=1 Tax=Tetrahymena thermophila (strain SB210) TaxID=312017 RepID=W7XHP5_TETTS|nr:hypothetical protein TTHERM_000729097 [Tetrahymena thermophila SB210]EWS72674.1 hypothetical protein TTHERM_000729097 [Tetrahymena thermophila SB210]|eukprot:XP_012654799.1 hypothetical protein TTHERM_000729097 [Tetrahymena thermophila SB210]
MSTFEQNLNTLLKLKQEVLGIKINYSSEIHNYHNLHMMEAQSNQLKNAYDEIDYLKQNTFDSQSKFNDLTKELKTYNEQLKKENLFLAQENNHLKNQVSSYMNGLSILNQLIKFEYYQSFSFQFKKQKISNLYQQGRKQKLTKYHQIYQIKYFLGFVVCNLKYCEKIIFFSFITLKESLSLIIQIQTSLIYQKKNIIQPKLIQNFLMQPIKIFTLKFPNFYCQNIIFFKKNSEQKDVEIHNRIKEKEQEINKYKRELENLKLMHSQELYILKKNQKK